jgi:nitroimidazol reductase NimA-like FMN-containing flavoprotein (pyridoxamine 5'-phosphate oxidase superfamily)
MEAHTMPAAGHDSWSRSSIPTVNTLEVLPEDKCLQLLGCRSVGCIAVVRDNQPLIFPVNYILEGRTVVFRTDPGTKLTWATHGHVAFEIESIDLFYREGWSVLVQGLGEEITDAPDTWSEHIRARVLVPWGGGAKDHWVAIASPVISGRRITHRAL